MAHMPKPNKAFFKQGIGEKSLHEIGDTVGKEVLNDDVNAVVRRMIGSAKK